MPLNTDNTAQNLNPPSAALPPGCDPRTVFSNIPDFYTAI